MTWMKALVLLTTLLAAVPALAATAAGDELPAENVYLVVVHGNQEEPDIAALGGQILRSWWDRRLVVLPSEGVASLRTHPGVAYVQRVGKGSEQAEARAAASEESPVRLSVVATSSAAVPLWTTGVYAYDGSGNVISTGAEWRYGYDAVGRIARARVARPNMPERTETYRYDPYGNLLQLGARTLSVDPATNRLTMPGVRYDVVGNVKQDAAGRTYHHDALGMVTAVQRLATDTFANDRRMIYTADDERIAVSEGSVTRYRVRDLSPRVLREWKSVSDGIPEWDRDYIYAGGTLVAGEVQVEQRENPLRHYHTDHLGSVRMVTNGAGELVAQHDYLPFGEELTPTTSEFKHTGKAPRDPLKYTGHERDYFTSPNIDGTVSDSIDYMHARYYAPATGRFLSVDPGTDWNMREPQSWNMYAYVRNDPLNLVDPDGRRSDAPRSGCRGYGHSKTPCGYLNKRHDEKKSTQLDRIFIRAMSQLFGVAATTAAVKGRVAGGAAAIGAVATSTKVSRDPNATPKEIAGGVIDGAAQGVNTRGLKAVVQLVVGDSEDKTTRDDAISGISSIVFGKELSMILGLTPMPPPEEPFWPPQPADQEKDEKKENDQETSYSPRRDAPPHRSVWEQQRH